MAQVQQWVVLQPLHKRGGRKTVIKLSPFGRAASVAQTNEDVWCQTGKHMGAQALQHSPGMPCLQIPLRDRLYLNWIQPHISPAEPEEEAGVGALKERKVSNMHTHTLFQLSGKKLCAASFGWTLQSHNYFISFRSFWGSVFCVSLRELPAHWEILIRFPRNDVSLIIF